MIQFSELDTTKSCEGLVPAIIQDDNTMQVLMLGYMNAEAYEKTVVTGKVTFYSRTRQCLWTKGETSGNFLTVKSIAKDCDSDTLLIRAIPAGYATPAARPASTVVKPKDSSKSCKVSFRDATRRCLKALTPPNCLPKG